MGFCQSFLYKEAFKMVVQLEPFDSIRAVWFHQVTDLTASLGDSWLV